MNDMAIAHAVMDRMGNWSPPSIHKARWAIASASASEGLETLTDRSSRN